MPDKSIVELVKELNESFDLFKAANDSHNKDVAKRLNDRMDEIEAKLNRKSGFNTGGSGTTQSESKRVFIDALRGKNVPLAELQSKALIVNSDPSGGYLAPPEYVEEIITDQTEYSPVRNVARVRGTSRHSVLIPKRTSTATASWVSETGTRSETTNPAFGMEEIRTHEMYAMTKVSRQEIEDAQFDLEAFLRAEFSEQFGLTEGTAFINGTSNGQPEGIMTNASIGEVVSGHASQITADGLIALSFELKDQYQQNSSWLLSRSTLKTIRQLKDANGTYIWSPGIRNEPRPATILDRPYTICPDMPSIGAGNYPVAYGDFRKGYIVVDRIVLEILPDPYSSKSTGFIEYTARKRVGGQVINANAVKKLKIST